MVSDTFGEGVGCAACGQDARVPGTAPCVSSAAFVESRLMDRDYQLPLQEAMQQLRNEVGENEYGLWLSQMEYLGATESEIGLAFPSSFYRDIARTRYKNRIETKLKSIIGSPVSLTFEIGTQSPSPPAPPPAPPAAQNETESIAPQDTRQSIPRETQQTMPLGKPALPWPATAPQSRASSALPAANLRQESLFGPEIIPAKVKRQHFQLRGDYIFERYIIGENNNFAANAAKAISLNSGTTKYNPFLIYGGAGLGKTHLMQAIGNYIYTHSDRKIIYISAENFLNEFVECIQKDKMSAFRNKYRFIDVLLIDDIQSLQKKVGVQDELFYIFNALYDTKKQIIFTCDRPVVELQQFSDRLRSRVGLGLTVDLQPPNYETRCAILKAKLSEHRTPIPDDVINLVAQNIATNIRDLEGALTTLIGYAELVGKPITVAVARQQLKGVLASAPTPAPVPPHTSVDAILSAVADYFACSTNDLRGIKRSKKIVEARQLAMYITKEITEFTNTEIGQLFGGREHSTVMHACQRVEEQIRSNPQLEASIEAIKRALTA
jgi:chromosomal replication initiator protein